MKWFNLILIVLIVGFFSYLFSGEIDEAIQNKFGKNEKQDNVPVQVIPVPEENGNQTELILKSII